MKAELKAGETVVTDGQLRLAPGAAVSVKNLRQHVHQRAVSIPALFIRRPVMTTLVMAGILLTGLIGFRQLPVSDLPNVDYPTISISASLPGASPQTMASAVATPLEKQLSTIAGVDSMSSVSSLGSVNITVQFSLDRNIDAAAQDVQAAIAQAAQTIAAEHAVAADVSKSQSGGFPDCLSGDVIGHAAAFGLWTITRKIMLAQRISMVNGVAQVNVFGSQQYAVRIQVDPNKLAAYGLGIDQVEQAVEQGNVNQPLGILYGKHQAFTVLANGQLNNAAEFRPLIVAYRNGNPVRLEQLGNVLDSVQNDKMAGWYQRLARGRAGGPAPARREHGGGGGQHQKIAAAVPRGNSRGGEIGRGH